MSRLRTTFSRLLALGGFTALSGSTFAYYRRYNLLPQTPTGPECSSESQFYEEPECATSSSGESSKRCWDDNWDRRNPTATSTNTQTRVQQEQKQRVNNKSDIPFLDAVSESVSTCSILDPVGGDIACGTRHVLLVRHGQYVYNEGDSFKVLTDLGRRQAALTGERLKSLGIKFTNLVASTMTRAQETASLIYEELQQQGGVEKSQCSLLREGAPYPLEPKSSVWNPLDKTFFKDNPRIEGAFRKYIHRADPKQTEDTYDLLVCHSNVIRYFVCRSLQFPPEGWGRMNIAHCGLTWLTIRPNGRVSLRGLGDIGHLPPNLITYH